MANISEDESSISALETEEQKLLEVLLDVVLWKCTVYCVGNRVDRE